jgi:hypothetical protein
MKDKRQKSQDKSHKTKVEKERFSALLSPLYALRSTLLLTSYYLLIPKIAVIKSFQK